MGNGLLQNPQVSGAQSPPARLLKPRQLLVFLSELDLHHSKHRRCTLRAGSSWPPRTPVASLTWSPEGQGRSNDRHQFKGLRRPAEATLLLVKPGDRRRWHAKQCSGLGMRPAPSGMKMLKISEHDVRPSKPTRSQSTLSIVIKVLFKDPASSSAVSRSPNCS